MASAVSRTTVSAEPVEEAGESERRPGKTPSSGEPSSNVEDEDRGVFSKTEGW